uniref:Eukaryotic translation initiation factor 5B n=1 Tax=Lygus hesperus TaxID=30085 RepID=A0A0A9W6Y5_LYGHE
MKELRVRSEFVHHKEIKAAMAVKLVGIGFENVIPGTPLLVVKPHDDRDEIGELVMRDASSISNNFSADGVGVTVQSSTLGALEALLSFLKDMKVPVGDAGIGPVRKKDLNLSILMKRRDPRYAIVLAFDVPIADDAREIAESNEVKIFEAQIIYKLFDMFTQYLKDYEKLEKERLSKVAVFPA